MRQLFLSIAAVLLAFPSPALAEWWEAETAHFVVKSRASEEDAREYAMEMEQFDAVLRTLQGMETGVGEASRANKPTIYRFGRPRDMARLLNRPGSGVSGFFIPRAGNSVAFAPTRTARDKSAKTALSIRQDPRTKIDPRSVLLHEYTHYFMLQHFPGAYPRWYVEGFAETLGTMRVNEDGSYHIGDPPQYRAAQVFQLQDFPLDEMLDDNHELTGLDALQHYATGWLLTHYMSFDSARLQKLRAYLVALANGEDSLTAAQREFGDLRALERELDGYKKGPFPGLRIAEADIDPTIKIRRLTAAEEDAIMDEMRLARGADKDEADDISKRLASLAQKHPGNAYILTLQATAEASAERYSDANSTAARALELDPGNTNAWLVRGFSALELAKEDPSWAERAREFAINAADSDNYDPRPQMLYYYTYSQLDEPAPEAAIIALEQVFDAAGGDTGYRLLLARQLLIESRFSSARAVLVPIAYAGHRTGEPEDDDEPYLPRLLEMVMEEDRDGALAMIQKIFDDEDDEEEQALAAS